MAGLAIAEKRRPQDGRIRFPHDDRTVDIRVSIIPTDFGEKVVLRLLDKRQLRLHLGGLGFSSRQLAIFEHKISASNGLILVTGPTGSGKTTTLYAALSYLNSPALNIVTVEDPIEYNLTGINQTQIRPEIGLTFSTMLRSLLRQDPNIIMVGEIRDTETLNMAVRASLTGHLVLSTLHTNDAVSAINRLADMGAERYLIASSLRLIVAQRLVRLNCLNCFDTRLNAEHYRAAELMGVTLSSAAGAGKGCDRCNHTGFRGRTALYEVLPVTEAIRRAIMTQTAEQEMLRMARADSFVTMNDMAADLINRGAIDILDAFGELRT
jgi:type IV pilus assembly protein PilB